MGDRIIGKMASVIVSRVAAKRAIERVKVRQQVVAMANRLAKVGEFERATFNALVENLNQFLDDHCLDIRLEIKEQCREDKRTVCPD